MKHLTRWSRGGTKVLGKSGSHKEVGSNLTDMTLGQIFKRQNGPEETHYQDGGLHAWDVINLLDVLYEKRWTVWVLVTTLNLHQNSRPNFFLVTQNELEHFSLIGPSIQYDENKRNHLNNLIPQL